MREQQRLPGKSVFLMPGAAGDLCPDSGPGEAWFAGAAAAATRDEVLARLLEERDTLLRTGVYSPADSVIQELDAEVQTRLLPTAAVATGRSSAFNASTDAIANTWAMSEFLFICVSFSLKCLLRSGACSMIKIHNLSSKTKILCQDLPEGRSFSNFLRL